MIRELPREVMQLGMEYVQIATRMNESTDYIDYMERMVREGLTLAMCGN